MNALQRLVWADTELRKVTGTLHTPAEIVQQPDTWRATRAVMQAQLDELRAWREAIHSAPAGPVLLTGAGSSHYVGCGLVPLLAGRLNPPVQAVSSTEMVYDPEGTLPAHLAGLVSFARSGDSPEGNAAFGLVSRLRPRARHLVFTCNPEGELAALAGCTPGAVRVVLPPETNDRGLAMTSSFTSLSVAGQALAYLDDFAAYADLVERLAAAADRLLAVHADDLAAVAGRQLAGAMFLGSGALGGAAMESALKVQELTGGRVQCPRAGTRGVRQGPRAAIGRDSLVVYLLSGDPYRRQYERDLMQEVAAKGLGGYRIAIADRADAAWDGLVDLVVEFDPAGELALPEAARPPVYVVAGQILGLFASLHLGLTPDSPGAGVISRTVQGVRIYNYSMQA